MHLEDIVFGDDGLVAAVVQDAQSRQVLMLAYMDKTALKKTLDTGDCWFFSRSRKRLWRKGETSGNTLAVEAVSYDCDGDAILVEVTPAGPTCHTGATSCFYRTLSGRPGVELSEQREGFLTELYEVILERVQQSPEGSYTVRLWQEGLQRIMDKVTEEAAEVVEAADIKDKGQVVYEISDLAYHVLVLMAFKKITPAEIGAELRRRRSG